MSEETVKMEWRVGSVWFDWRKHDQELMRQWREGHITLPIPVDKYVIYTDAKGTAHKEQVK